MFDFCMRASRRRAYLNPNGKHYAQVVKTLSNEEIILLELIYSDLSARNSQNLLTLQNFLLFFGLTGLWGAKLFRLFDEDSKKQITKQQFCYGLSRTAKAPYQQKIKQMFNFFKDQEDNGIHYIDFTKMLYNYSRDDLKEILMEDMHTMSELNRAISQKISSCYLQNNLISSNRNSSKQKKQTIIEVNYEQPETKVEELTCFSKNFAERSQRQGTVLELKVNQLTYKVNYCNMITLVKEFAKKIYISYNIDIKNGIFTIGQFQQWIQCHNKLFESYYTSFHIDVWGYSDGQPNYLSKVQHSFTTRMLLKQKITQVYAMLVGDVLIIAESVKQKKQPYKIICLQGLTMRNVTDKYGYGVQFAHREECYQNCLLYFKTEAQQQKYIQRFRQYEGVILHDLYDTHQVVGTGKFSIVYRCTQKQTGKSYALKDMSTQKLTPQAIRILDNQSQIMKIISHPNIVKYQETIKHKAHIYIITEFIPGKDLFEFVKKRKRLSQYSAALIIGKIIEATQYLHSLQIIHRDLKPQNIMITTKKKSLNLSSSTIVDTYDQIQSIKIIDFGLANHESQIQKNKQKFGLVGTPNYIAPQIILRKNPTKKSDNFSIGSILYFLLSGKLAFAYCNMEQTLIRSATGKYDMSDPVWNTISDQAKDLVARLLDTNPVTRISIDEALNHQWFEIVTQNRQKSQSDRLSACSSSSCNKQIDKLVGLVEIQNQFIFHENELSPLVIQKKPSGDI